MKKKKNKKSLKAARRGRMSSDSKPKQGFVSGIKHRDIPLKELKAILQKAKSSPLNEADLKKLNGAVDTLAVVTTELELKGVSISRLRKLIFGASTEKTRNIFKDNKLGRATNNTDKLDTDRNSDAKKKQDKPKPKGHGRLAASDYQGAEKVEIKHQKLKPGDNCPECLTGKLYTQNAPAQLVRVSGMAPLNATVYELERLRCNLCGEIFTASSPDTVGEKKYDNSAAAMLALLKYGYGLPFNLDNSRTFCCKHNLRTIHGRTRSSVFDILSVCLHPSSLCSTMPGTDLALSRRNFMNYPG
jgi:hypothetical protein